MIFNIIPGHTDASVPSVNKFKTNGALKFTMVHEQPFPLPHNCAINKLQNTMLAVHRFLH